MKNPLDSLERQLERVCAENRDAFGERLRSLMQEYIKEIPYDKEYDRETCVTALELRQQGLPLHGKIPDLGWIPKKAVRYQTGPEGDVQVTFGEGFQWIEFEFDLKDPSE